ncbi:MAG: Na+/proline symporter/signal transduction histidine kinase [Candidatus Midichloriaceae bacterium]|jgi:Na+/proline symporter/signal transduction histidine kinase
MEKMGKLHIIDVSIVGIYLLLCVIIGLYKSTKIANIKEYALGNRNFSTFTIIATIFATFISANATLGIIGHIYELGLVFAISLFFMPLNWLIIKLIYAKNIDKFNSCISISEIMEKLYGNIGSYITSIVSLITAIVFIAIQVTAIGYLFNYFFNLTYIQGILIGFTVLMLYSAFGGIRAVVLTDVFQFFIFFLALPIACGYAYYKAGSYNTIINSIPNSHLEIFTDTNHIMQFFSYIILMTLPAMAAPYVQRLLMAKNKSQLLHSYNILIVVAVIFSFVIFILGFSIRSLYPDIEGKIALYHFIAQLSPIFIGFLVSGMLAVIMSSADSWLNAASVIIAHDIVKKKFPHFTPKQELLTAMLMTFCTGIVAVIIALNSGEIFKLMILVQSFAYSTILVPFTAGFLNIKSNKTSFVFSVISGVFATVFMKYLTGEFGIISLAIGVIGSSIGFFGANYYQVKKGIIKIEKPVYKEYRQHMYQRVKKSIGNLLSTSKIENKNKSFYYIFALFIIILNIPIIVLGYNSFNNFIYVIIRCLRYISLFLALLLLIHELFTQNYLMKLWNLTLFFTLPLTGMYIFASSGYDIICGINFLLLNVILFLLVNVYNACLISVFGWILGIIMHIGVSIYNPNLIPNHHIVDAFISTYSLGILCLSIIYIAYNKLKEDKLKHQILETLGSAIAHDVSTPLSTNIMMIEIMNNALEKNDYDTIKEYLDHLKICNTQAIQDVDLMLNTIKSKNNYFTDWENHSIINCINTALKRYYMNEEQRKRVTFLDINNKEKDFTFVGSETLLRHVIFNLLKNALKYAGNNAKIEIFLGNNKLHIRDNGYGIKKEVFANLFQKYVTTGGIGIGLNFCKEAMITMKGEITCISKKDKGTEFIISFK